MVLFGQEEAFDIQEINRLVKIDGQRVTVDEKQVLAIIQNKRIRFPVFPFFLIQGDQGLNAEFKGTLHPVIGLDDNRDFVSIDCGAFVTFVSHPCHLSVSVGNIRPSDHAPIAVVLITACIFISFLADSADYGILANQIFNTVIAVEVLKVIQLAVDGSSGLLVYRGKPFLVLVSRQGELGEPRSREGVFCLIPQLALCNVADALRPHRDEEQDEGKRGGNEPDALVARENEPQAHGITPHVEH